MAVDINFSADDGWGETRHVYLEGNGLPGAWAGRPRWVVSELGFGTGLNLAALVHLKRTEAEAGRPGPELVYQSVEWAPRAPHEVAALAAAWPDLAPDVAQLLAVYDPQPGWNLWAWEGVTVRLFVGDARQLPSVPGPWEGADSWFLDGYAPDRNPELWGADLLAWAGRMTAAGGTAATYTAAGVVKQALRAAGFQVTRAPGWGKKRHMVRAFRLAGPQDFC